jgi:hypothetical protein
MEARYRIRANKQWLTNREPGNGVLQTLSSRRDRRSRPSARRPPASSSGAIWLLSQRLNAFPRLDVGIAQGLSAVLAASLLGG